MFNLHKLLIKLGIRKPIAPTLADEWATDPNFIEFCKKRQLNAKRRPKLHKEANVATKGEI